MTDEECREFVSKFVDATHLTQEEFRLALCANLIYVNGGEWALTEFGRSFCNPPPGDSASCPDDDSYSPPLWRGPHIMPQNPSKGVLDVQVAGSHYKNFTIQPVEFIEKNNIPFLEGCVIKRMCRHGAKAGAEDLRKAKHEIDLLLQLRYGVTE